MALTHNNSALKTLWNWLGEREVFFCEEKGNIFTNSSSKMIECFKTLHYIDNIMFWKLESDAKKRGMVDVMGSFFDITMKEDELCILATHSADGEENDCIEQWKIIPSSSFDFKKHYSNIRELCDRF